jgi:predicted nucleotidyltransferase
VAVLLERQEGGVQPLGDDLENLRAIYPRNAFIKNTHTIPMAPEQLDDGSIREVVGATLSDHPISVGILFGSPARRETNDRSDIDVAVVFEDTVPGDPGHLDARLALGADLALALGTDDIDVVDMQSASPSLVRAILRDGDRLIGTEADVEQLRTIVCDDTAGDSRSPGERFDAALTAIDEHLV